MARLRFTRKADLLVLLDELAPYDGQATIGPDTVDFIETYMANCKDAPAAATVVLPWPSFAKCPDLALTRFRNFCLSQLGQHKSFTLHYVDGGLPLAPSPAWHTYSDPVTLLKWLYSKCTEETRHMPF